MKYRIFINDRKYLSWKLFNNETNQDIPSTEYPDLFNPFENKLFSTDVFTYLTEPDNSNKKIQLNKSPVRESALLSGILILSQNKTFGRTKNSKRLLYKCIPDDIHLPIFLIPYDIKSGFSKNITNKYITFKFANWNDLHPHGILFDNLGDTDNIEAFYEYQLYCKSLHESITNFSNKTRAVFYPKIGNADQSNQSNPSNTSNPSNPSNQSEQSFISKIINNPKFVIENREHEYVFAIDPLNSLDFDDALGISPIIINGKSLWKVSVYIANVYFWLETFGLWDAFSKRVSTIYLPDKRRPMLPTILSDNLCSLMENQSRFAFVMDIIIDEDGTVYKNDDNNVVETSIKFSNCLIKVSKNYEYENPELIYNNSHYTNLFNISKKMDKTINNSHDLVAHWMIQMNVHCSRYMSTNKMGIFRSTINNIDTNISKDIVLENPNPNDILIGNDTINGINPETERIIKNYNTVSGRYVLFSENANLEHSIMKLGSYIHITSPIRRLVDLLNQMIMINHLSHSSKNDYNKSTVFLNNWLNQIDYINITMRSIRRVQTDCELLHAFHINPEILNEKHTGVLFNKISTGTQYTYMVYLEKLKITSKIYITENLDNYTQHLFTIYLFENEDKLKRKIRIMIV
jgi:exoribonuclease R